MMTSLAPIRVRERDTILQALAAGVVPRIGLQHIQVGRAQEVEALTRDIERIIAGSSSIRFVIGEYGAGKTFFLNLVRLMALDNRLVTVHADLAVDRRLHATGGQARNLYAEAVRNMATRSRPEGGSVASIVERFIADAVESARLKGLDAEEQIQTRLTPVRELVGGYDFADVIGLYWKASATHDEDLRTAALRWLRGEFSSKTDARAALGVRTIVDDASVYDHWKLWGRFVRLAGYAGLLVMFDELINVYKLNSPQARNSNYEQILRIFNDTLQANVEGVGFLLAGPPDFLTDLKRGLYSYPALHSRLAENQFASGDLIDLAGPVVRLENLTPEDLNVLLKNIRRVFAHDDPARHLVSDDGLRSFMAYCDAQIGESYFCTPRTTIKSFVHFLNVLDQNPGTDWRNLLDRIVVEPDVPEEAPEIIDED